MIYIYILSDPRTNLPKYIGKTKQSPTRRYSQHISSELNNGDHKSNWIKSLKNLGLKPIIEVIDQTEDTNWQWLEQYWIEQFRQWGFKLTNLTIGGEPGCVKHTEESKRRISESNKGRVFSTETRLKISNSHKGKIVSDVTKQKLRQINLGKIYSEQTKLKKSKAVLQFDKQMNFIREHSSLTKAAEVVNGTKGNINNCIVGRNRMKTYKGFIWKYKNEDIV